MNRFKRYALILEHDPADLVRTVTTALSKGWVPAGGVSISPEPVANANAKARRMCYTQAVVLPFRPEDAYGLGAAEEDEKIPGAHMVKSAVKLAAELKLPDGGG
jgi:hypothetical protein